MDFQFRQRLAQAGALATAEGEKHGAAVALQVTIIGPELLEIAMGPPMAVDSGDAHLKHPLGRNRHACNNDRTPPGGGRNRPQEELDASPPSTTAPTSMPSAGAIGGDRFRRRRRP